MCACQGTTFGISAAAYPDLTVANLTLDEAKALYRRDYWNWIAGDRLAPALALLAFDAAINKGTGGAVGLLQQAAGVVQDGLIGPITFECDRSIAERSGHIAKLCAEFLAQRLTFMTALPTWKTSASAGRAAYADCRMRRSLSLPEGARRSHLER